MNTALQYIPTASDISAAYRRAGLRRKGITLLRALNDPLLYKALTLQACAEHDQQQHGTPAPMKQAA